MKRLPRSRFSPPRIVVAALFAWLLAWGPAAAQAAELKSFFGVRRTLGVGFLGGAVMLTMKGLDYRQQADDLYDRYNASSDEAEVARLYQRTTNRDVKSQVTLALAAAFAVSGVRLILSEQPRKTHQPAVTAAPDRAGLHLGARLDVRRLGLGLTRRFF
jgi:hypothetical protein